MLISRYFSKKTAHSPGVMVLIRYCFDSRRTARHSGSTGRIAAMVVLVSGYAVLQATGLSTCFSRVQRKSMTALR